MIDASWICIISATVAVAAYAVLAHILREASVLSVSL